MQFDKKRLWFLTIPLFILPFMFHGCGTPAPDVKNRVPTVSAQLDQAQQAVKDAQAAAASAQQSQKNIQDAIAKLDTQWRDSNGDLKPGHPEISGVGVVTEVGETKQTTGESSSYVFWFTFAERAGFVKKFPIVCPNQIIPVSNPIILNFHWHPYEDSGNPGCYVIDGYTVVK